MTAHKPVLVKQLQHMLMPDDHRLERAIDGTLGAGGHTRALLEAGAAEVLAFDLDASAIALARRNLAAYEALVQIHHRSYLLMDEVARERGWETVDGILLDLGLSSMQLDNPERGFAFRHDARLDMRFDQSATGPTAADLINSNSESELADLFFRYGEERAARRIARAIVEQRPVESTGELANLVASVVGSRRRTGKTHPATKTFQALRIAVNRELETIEKALPIAIDLLRPGGRLAVITFHSLEDRIVKRGFRDLATNIVAPPGMASMGTSRALIRPVTRKPITPDSMELGSNPRSRSAKLRVVEKLDCS